MTRHVITVHWRSSRWVNVQARYLARFGGDHQVWVNHEETDMPSALQPIYAESSGGTHAEKLDRIAVKVCTEAAPDDVLVFLDGDAFPIADFSEAEARLASTDLVAVRRLENSGDPQPHPSFALVRVETWQRLAGC